MKKTIFLLLGLLYVLPAKSWWDPGHLVTAMIAYRFLDEDVKARVDGLAETLRRDYPQVNHFIATGPWPDDLKADGVRSYDTWHYTNIPYNPNNLPLPPKPEVDIIWAIDQCRSVLEGRRAKEVDKARHLGFLVHFVADLHQPLHSTSVFSNALPGGNIGGNSFPLKGNWRNLHMLWDDGCGFLSDYNDINPYGKPKEPLTKEEMERIKQLADQLVEAYPMEQFSGVEVLDPDFWALESHKLAVKHAYQGINKEDEYGRKRWISPEEEPSEIYLKNGQEIVQQQLALGGYRLAMILNEIFGD